MTDEQKQRYVETMKAKAIAYAENVLSDVKSLMSKDDYAEAVRGIAQAFLDGADAAIKTAQEINADK